MEMLEDRCRKGSFHLLKTRKHHRTSCEDNKESRKSESKRIQTVIEIPIRPLYSDDWDILVCPALETIRTS